jgi:hypothetical protein
MACRVSGSCFRSLDTSKFAIRTHETVILGSHICFSQLTEDAAIAPDTPKYDTGSNGVGFACFDCELVEHSYSYGKRKPGKFDGPLISDPLVSDALPPPRPDEIVKKEPAGAEFKSELVIETTSTSQNREDRPDVTLGTPDNDEDSLDEGGIGDEWSEWIGSEAEMSDAKKINEKNEDHFNFPLMVVIAVMFIGFSVIFALLIHSEQERVEREKEARLRWQKGKGVSIDTY